MYKKMIGAFALMITIGTSAHASQGVEAKLGILSGCWRGEFDDTTVEEHWDRLSGGLMLGTAKTVKNDVAVEFEFLKITVSQSEVLYTPYINGAPAGPFKLANSASSTTKLVFENPANDFPKKIVYTKNRTAIEIALLGDSQSDSIQYALESVDCKN